VFSENACLQDWLLNKPYGGFVMNELILSV